LMIATFVTGVLTEKLAALDVMETTS
jgi:hypothetical protein